MEGKLFLPFKQSKRYLSQIPKKSIIYGRFANDFQKGRLLFTRAQRDEFDAEYLEYLKQCQLQSCYVYDVFDLENREFTIEGYKCIIADIDNIVQSGFSYIMVSNPYIIEILCNEYKESIRVVISSNLEINSERGRLFFEVINDISSIYYMVVSQNHLTKNKLISIQKAFRDMNIVIEIDRFASDNQIIHEHYYNIIYGNYNVYAVEILKNFVNENKKFAKTPEALFYDNLNLTYKIGEMNASTDIILANMAALQSRNISEIKVVDFHLWD